MFAESGSKTRDQLNAILVFPHPIAAPLDATPVEVDSLVRSVFGHFQNLNLLALIQDLRAERVAQGDWASGKLLCPVAHGMPLGQVIADLRYLSQSKSLSRACGHAARFLGADPFAIRKFVDRWDWRQTGPSWLLRQLEMLWHERLTDAEAAQAVLHFPGLAESEQDSESEPALMS